jgi:hypothetical protein
MGGGVVNASSRFTAKAIPFSPGASSYPIRKEEKEKEREKEEKEKEKEEKEKEEKEKEKEEKEKEKEEKEKEKEEKEKEEKGKEEKTELPLPLSSQSQSVKEGGKDSDASSSAVNNNIPDRIVSVVTSQDKSDVEEEKK